MLSRVADNLYWFSRYVRRAENVARLVEVGSQLQLDLPRAARFAWRPLVDTLGAGEEFDRWHGEGATPSEAEVVRFMLVEPDNPLSLRGVVGNAREILRTVRETMPQDCWVAINDLHLYIEAGAERAGSRRHRHEFLARVIDSCLRVSALLSTNVSRDIGYQFLRLGAAIEQADMTSRIIDAAAAGLIQPRAAEDVEAFRAMQWMSVLQSLAAYQMYRRHLRQRVSVELALQFLLKDREFPRSVLFCLARIQAILPQMPPRRPVQQAFRRSLGLVFDADPAKLAASGPCDFMDRLQVELAALHGAIHESYFVG
ncbi:alpha-E domain-containing protein [Frateuria defendens]|uniref:alpha-E domain-containing protein n=1 Tax=Frateuria defendens TaxID=2219559 RepID=UPI00066FB9E8|nr:alpha-E domain-containing protein [Frateuria defendens]